MKLAIVKKYEPQLSRRELKHVQGVANWVRRERPQVGQSSDAFRHLVVNESIDDSPSLVLDDFSEIPVIGTEDSAHILQQRARFRAVDGDWVAQVSQVESGFSDYCEYTLNLGRVNWLQPVIEPSSPRQLALECWQDRRLRHDLVNAIRKDGLRYIHPHVSTLHVWELATLLRNASRRPLSVIAPSPQVARWANDKVDFTRAVSRLIGRKSVPHTESAFNFATLSKQVSMLSPSYSLLGIKYPYGTGGQGNFLIDTDEISGFSLAEVREYLKKLLDGHRWPESGRVLIDVWAENVLTSPSVQTWIPPQECGVPIIEGVFEQSVIGEECTFVGSRPAILPTKIEEKIVSESYMLAMLFQELGYVGRCSFDLILTGSDIENACVVFIECNARWGGTSIPMTLMHQMGVMAPAQTWRVQKVGVPGLDKLNFAAVMRSLKPKLYEPRSQTGRFVLMNPSRIKNHSAIDAIAIGKCPEDVNVMMTKELPDALAALVPEEGTSPNSEPRVISTTELESKNIRDRNSL